MELDNNDEFGTDWLCNSEFSSEESIDEDIRVIKARKAKAKRKKKEMRKKVRYKRDYKD